MKVFIALLLGTGIYNVKPYDASLDECVSVARGMNTRIVEAVKRGARLSAANKVRLANSRFVCMARGVGQTAPVASKVFHLDRLPIAETEIEE